MTTCAVFKEGLKTTCQQMLPEPLSKVSRVHPPTPHSQTTMLMMKQDSRPQWCSNIYWRGAC